MSRYLRQSVVPGETYDPGDVKPYGDHKRKNESTRGNFRDFSEFDRAYRFGNPRDLTITFGVRAVGARYIDERPWGYEHTARVGLHYIGRTLVMAKGEPYKTLDGLITGLANAAGLGTCLSEGRSPALVVKVRVEHKQGGVYEADLVMKK